MIKLKDNIKIVSLILTWALILIKAECQIKLSLTGGINYCNLDTRLIPSPHREYERDHFYYRLLFNFGIGAQYKFEYFDLFSGTIISCRGTKSIDLVPNPFYFVFYYSYTFLEIPILFKRSLINNKCEVGVGVVNSFRMAENVVTSGDEHEIYNVDLKLSWSFLIVDKLNIELSYLFGGIDKILGSKSDNYLHNVYALNFNYFFYNRNN